MIEYKETSKRVDDGKRGPFEWFILLAGYAAVFGAGLVVGAVLP